MNKLETILILTYLIGGISFILGLKKMSSPKTAYNGNLIAASGMAIIVLATVIYLIYHVRDALLLKVILLIIALGVGGIIGWLGAVKVKMTAMPQMVSLFNGMGGICAALIGVFEYPHFLEKGMILPLIPSVAGIIIGATSFSGSIIAFLKLNGNLKKDIRFRGQLFLNMGIFLISVLLGIYMVISPGMETHIRDYHLEWVLLGISVIYGICMVLPIGGADMPVVISLLNSFTGVAAGLGGFIYNNMAMITGGILVGSAGMLLTILMCRAMNRSLWNVLIGGVGATTAKEITAKDKVIKEITPSDTAILLNYSKKIAFVPGYGLAVAQAQFVMHEIEKLLEERGVEVSYGIHPVAGRMPGHMNVLLAEAQVPYEKLKEMEEINPEFDKTDCVLIVGANDVVNPDAENNPSSPLYGMPILQVYKAKKVIVIKRSMRSGYAGVDNPLFYYDNAYMLFGDGKSVLTEILEEIKKL